MSRRPSPLDNKPCRQCSSFSDYIKESREKLKTKQNIDESELMCKVEGRIDCPLDKDELGNKTWGFLHTVAANYSENPTFNEKKEMEQFIHLFSKFYPCEHCASDLQKELVQNPPLVTNQAILSQWLCKLHNNVNIKLGKPQFDCSKVNERWRDGWLDGSCD